MSNYYVITHDTQKGEILYTGPREEAFKKAEETTTGPTVTVLSEYALGRLFVRDGNTIINRQFLN